MPLRLNNKVLPTGSAGLILPRGLTRRCPAKTPLSPSGRDMNVVLDVTPPELHGLTINGKLSFADNKDLELTTEWIMVHGELEIGTEAKPHTRNATITLTDNVKGEDFGGMGGNGPQ